jgi:signal transduction histidine kinase
LYQVTNLEKTPNLVWHKLENRGAYLGVVAILHSPMEATSTEAMGETRDRLRRRLLFVALGIGCAIAGGEVARQLLGQNQALAAGVAAATLAAQAALIAGLLVQRRRWRQTEERLRCREAELQKSYERIRDIGGRLLTAQEAERSRIGRELHDDITQQLVLLEMGLREAGSDEESVGRVTEIARSVRELSHRLHPAGLELLGLVESLHALAAKHSQPEIAVSFTHCDVPQGLSPAVSLCLYRVVQEALQNAVRYSQATQVSVDLRRGRTALVLMIADNGVGFDLEKAVGKGLGLISVRERVAAIGGSVVIHSNTTRCTGAVERRDGRRVADHPSECRCGSSRDAASNCS